jgi:hypothetical protein
MPTLIRTRPISGVGIDTTAVDAGVRTTVTAAGNMT